uniref:Uncharacterized protein n=1 Tax=Triticum urartu TaxID=4572 RepID=A0A8R7TEU5_TRIUA
MMGWTVGSSGEKRAAVDRESHDDGRLQLPLPPLVGAARPLSPRPSFPSVRNRSAHRPSPIRVLLLGTSMPRSLSSSLSTAAGGLDWIGLYLLYYLFENLRCGPPNLRPQKEDLRVEKGHLNVIWRKELSRNQNVIILLFCRGESKDYLFLFMPADRV